MHIPTHYKNENLEEVSAFLQQNSFGILINQTNGKLWGTHIPLELDKDEDGSDVLLGHVGKANPQGQNFKDNQEVLAIFQGPHSYVSSSWYEIEEVPTWNYIAVHVYGTIQIIEGEALWDSLKKLVDKYEQNSENPVSMENLSPKTLRQIKGIIGFKIKITDIQAAYKLSQTRTDTDHQHIVRELEKTDLPDAKATAAAMKKNRGQ